MRRHSYIIFFLLLAVLPAAGFHKVYNPQVKSLQVVVNQNWQSLPVMKLNSEDRLHVSFDELSRLTLPNDQCRLTMSGNYRLHIREDGSDEDILTAEFIVTEQSMLLSMAATTNTDTDTNGRHQQVTMAINYRNLAVTQPEEQIRTVVMQNGREDNCRRNVRPSYISLNGLEWDHCRELIFEAGNEYRKYEVLDPSHPTLGIDYIRWDGEYYQVFPFMSEPRPNYLYDEDADGAFYIRNSDNRENDTVSDYVWVNYRLKSQPGLDGQIVIDGMWATEADDTYRMTYDAEPASFRSKDTTHTSIYGNMKTGSARCFPRKVVSIRPRTVIRRWSTIRRLEPAHGGWLPTGR